MTKETVISYCQVCSKDFKAGQRVFFVPIDNNIACEKCAYEANTEIQVRLYKGEGEQGMKVELENYDIKRIKKIAHLQGLDSENLTDAEIWCIVSDSLIERYVSLKIRSEEQK